MKKIILAILAVVFVVFGNSIVGTWVDEDGFEIVFEEGGRVWFWVSNDCDDRFCKFPCEEDHREIWEFTYSVNGNEITMFPKGEAPYTFLYDGGDVFVIDLEGESPETFTRKIPTSISTRQRAQAQSNFQISRNSNSLHLNFADNSLKRIEIVNLQGRILNSQSFSAKTQSVDISNLPRGVFVLRVFEGSGVGVVRFVRE